MSITDCYDHILAALVAEQAHRPDRDVSGPDGWVHLERVAVAAAANSWAWLHPPHLANLTAEDIERIEQTAIGHVDYSHQLALRVAELVIRKGTS